MLKSLKPVAMVTGASSGIGAALCRLLVKRNNFVIGLARSYDKLLDLQKELGDNFLPLQCDISSKLDIKLIAQLLQQKNIIPSLFYLNAGMAGECVIESPETFKIEHHERVMSVNYFGVLSFVEFWQKSCQDNGGAKFIVTSSVNALFAPPGGSAYCASKAAVSKAFEGLSLTYTKTNLRFSIIYAGPVKTKGLVGKLPFVWNAEKMANYMVEFASTNKKSGYPSKFYGMLCMILKNLPQRIVLKILGIS